MSGRYCHSFKLKTFLETECWKPYIENSICLGTFGKWGSLKPYILYWIYIAVIRIILIYRGVVWWKVDNTPVYLSWIAINGTVKSTPHTSWKLCWIFFPLIYICIKTKACKLATLLKKSDELTCWLESDRQFDFDSVYFDKTSRTRIPSKERNDLLIPFSDDAIPIFTSLSVSCKDRN